MEVDKAYSVNNTQFIRTSIRTWSQGYCQIAIVHKLAEPVQINGFLFHRLVLFWWGAMWLNIMDFGLTCFNVRIRI